MASRKEKFLKDNSDIMLIVNPKAGKKYKKLDISEVSEYFAKHDHQVAVYYTSLQYGAEYLIQQYAKDYDVVACCGGDGTVECIQGMMNMDNPPPLGYIPAGSTNDLASSLNLSTNSHRASKTILNGDDLPFDIGKFDDGYFVYIASFGAFTEVSYNTPQKAKNLFGHAAYIFSAIRSMARIRSYHLKIEADGTTYEDEYIFGSITNSTSVAGTFHFDTDMVDFDDGKHELLLIRKPKSLWNAFAICMSMLNRSFKNDNILLTHAQNITIYSDEPLDWALDGEHKQSGTVTHIETIPHAVRIIRKK